MPVFATGFGNPPGSRHPGRSGIALPEWAFLPYPVGHPFLNDMARNSIDHAALPMAPKPRRRSRAKRAVASHADLLWFTEPGLGAPPSLEQVTSVAAKLGRCTTEHILAALEQPVTRRNEMAVAAHLKTLGYSKSRVMVRGVRVHAYFPPANT